jgi:branched-chain amino acid aminotransferase
MIPLLATSGQVCTWPGGTGVFKLGLNCVPGFVVQRTAAVLGYEQLYMLWLLGETVAGAGAMNVFAMFEPMDGGELALVLLLLLHSVHRANILATDSLVPL